MKSRLILILTCWLCFGTHVVRAQEPVLSDSIGGFSGKFTTDPIGNLYLYHKGDLTRFTPEGLETNKYSRRDYGDIGYVDALNPMKVLVVYPEFSRAVVLDASLSQQSDIHLSFQGIPYVRLVCLSRESGFWFYDPMGRKLIHMNDQLDFIAEGTPLYQVSDHKIEQEPTFLSDSGDWLILYIPGHGILVFDRYGTYFKTIREEGVLKNIRAFGNDVIWQHQSGMTRYNIKTGASSSMTLPPDLPDIDCRVEGNRMYIRSGDVLKIYSF
jgi:hypothetical protein